MRDEDPRLTRLRELGAAIGTDIYVGPDVYIETDFAPLLTIEDGVVLSQGTTILLHDSSLNNLVGAPIKFGAVSLRQGCYLGANTLVMCGVEVGEGALVGAAALVRDDVPAGMVAYGAPARIAGTVEELVERSRSDEHADRFFRVEAPRWRDRTLDQDQVLLDDIGRGMERWLAARADDVAPRPTGEAST
jgi:carbonic anhydrase/acetyltransferase-like protein (isoleucine patch superfamily)